jgi:hypothetical protein
LHIDHITCLLQCYQQAAGILQVNTVNMQVPYDLTPLSPVAHLIHVQFDAYIAGYQVYWLGTKDLSFWYVLVKMTHCVSFLPKLTSCRYQILHPLEAYKRIFFAFMFV